ncbi:hypothetical protein KR009_000932 [Drosophila setifemur]|nr:hypothetical protein KR009_000932 [Drosophila setifemur]
MKTITLKSHMLKEMQLSFNLTEEREASSGRRKPEKRSLRPVAPKPKEFLKGSPPAEVPASKKIKVDDISPQKSNGNKQKVPQSPVTRPSQKKPIQKRPSSTEPSKSDASPSTKKPKPDVSVTLGSPKANSKKATPIKIYAKPEIKHVESKKATIKTNAKQIPGNNSPNNDGKRFQPKQLGRPKKKGSSESDAFSDEDDDFFRAPKIFKLPKGSRVEKPSLSAQFEEPVEDILHKLNPDSDGIVTKILVFENVMEESGKDSDDSSNDSEWSQDSENSDSEDFDSEDFDEEDFDSDESDNDDFDISAYNSDLDSTFEPSDFEESFEDVPLHMQREPLTIEEIFDEPPVKEMLKELPKVKPAVEEIAGGSTKMEVVLEDSVKLLDISSKKEEPQDLPLEKEESIKEPPNEKEEQNSQLIDTPFYRNPQSNTTELSVFENSLKSNYVLAVIKEDLELYGTVVLTLLSGQVTVNGYRALRQKPLTIYSPKGLNWVCVCPTKTKKPAKDEVNWQQLNENFSRAQLDRINGSFQNQTDAIVLLQRNSRAQHLVATFGKHMAQNAFPQVNATNRPYHQSESLLHCLIQSSDGQRTLQVPQVWNKLKLQASSRVMITGGKGVGKSSLMRYLINRNLGQFPSILLIDLDIGQPEVFVPQTVSCTLIDEPLLGPGFMFNKQPDRAYVVGHCNIVMCAEQYARAVIQLIQHIQKDSKYQGIPWLVNTMGYNKGFGTELIALLVDRLRPTDLVQIASPIAINNFDHPLDWSSLSQTKPIIYSADEFKVKEIPKYTLHKLQSAVPPRDRGSWSMSAKDMRYSNLLARLSSCLRENAKSLTDCQPLGVSLESLKIQHATSDCLTRDELIQGMEANVVYLCHQGTGLAECLGIGVVRAIDYQSQRLFLVPAMPLQRMSLVNCLMPGGELTLPQGYFRDQGTGVSSNVPFVFILDDTKSSKSIQQIYHRTPAFLGVPVNQRN